MTLTTPQRIGLFVALLTLAFLPSKGCEWKPAPPPVVVPVVKADSVTYVWEKDIAPIPPAVRSALNILNRQGIKATEFEQNTEDGTGDLPEQYKLPLAAAREAGLPALIVVGGGKVLKVVKSPKTESEVLEAAK